jgi:ubiquinone/menaquinone biosynthesis C-methylase UbiE
MSYRTAEYDSEASSYDETRFSNKLGQHLDYMHKKILGSFINSSGKLVLEAGIGTGRFATWLAKKGFEVVGIDISREMLKKAKERKEILNADIGLALADAHFLPFRKGLFDNCICINVMDHFSDVDGFLRQVKHVIRSEGYFIFNFSNSRSIYLPIAIIINLRKRALFKSVQSCWFTIGEVNALMSRDGFDVKRIKGCFIASPLPLGDKLVRIIQMINFSIENSRLQSFSGSLFVKAQLINHPVRSQ